MVLTWYLIVTIIAIGFVAGFINTLAGSGSLLTLPMLKIFVGLPATVANGTNRIAILLQSLVGVGSFKQQKALDIKDTLWITIPTIIGSLVGAQIAVEINEKVMNYSIGAVMIIMFFLILFKPDMWVGNTTTIKPKNKWFNYILFFLIGIYGGFMQASVGIFLLAGLVLSAGIDLVKANALKLLIVLIYTPFALFIFIYNDLVDYKIGLILSIGTMAGAWVASRIAVKKGSAFVRYFLLLAIFLSALEMFGFFDFLFSIFNK